MKKNIITPAIIEDGVESAKNFISKLITPAFEETGLLIKDQVTRWRFNNQVKMINKAKTICEKNKINPKAISLKLLVPLLDYSSIEENDEMQDKWSILLSNLVDSEQNIENHVFPYVLSQLSRGEFYILELVYEEKQQRVKRLQKELDEFRLSRPQKELEINKRIVQINAELPVAMTEMMINKRAADLSLEKKELERQLRRNTHQEDILTHNIKKPESLPYLVLQDFEESNLIRLGLIKEVKEFYANSQTLEIPIDPGAANYETGLVNVDLEVDVDSKTDIILTQLGELFISACKEKNK